MTYTISSTAVGTGASILSVKTTSYSVLLSDAGSVIPVDVTSNLVDIILPAASVGFCITVEDSKGLATALKPITVAVAKVGSAKLNGVSLGEINIIEANTSITLISNGVDWYTMGGLIWQTTISLQVSRGLFFGGSTGSAVNAIDYIQMATTNNSSTFGELATAATEAGACSSATRSIIAGGGDTKVSIEYVTLATTGNSTSFGNLVGTTGTSGCVGLSSSTRGVFRHGNYGGTFTNVLSYITIASTGNSTDFGDAISTPTNSASVTSPTIGVFSGGKTASSTYTNVIGYITIATVGNETDFGDLITAVNYICGMSSSTIGIMGGGNDGSNYHNVLQYITIASLGNSTDFGDLSIKCFRAAGCSSKIKGIVQLGYNTAGAARTNIIEYVIIATLGNSVDFGDLTAARSDTAGTSGCHGGI